MIEGCDTAAEWSGQAPFEYDLLECVPDRWDQTRREDQANQERVRYCSPGKRSRIEHLSLPRIQPPEDKNTPTRRPALLRAPAAPLPQMRPGPGKAAVNRQPRRQPTPRVSPVPARFPQ